MADNSDMDKATFDKYAKNWRDAPARKPDPPPMKPYMNADKSYWAKTLKSNNANDPNTSSRPNTGK